MQRSMTRFLFAALWTTLLIVALVVQAIPIFAVVMMLSLAVGFSKGAALTVIPVTFIGMLYLSCLIASRLTKSPAERARAAALDAGFRQGPVPAAAEKPVRTPDYYRHVRRLG